MKLYQKLKIQPSVINGCTNTVKFRKRPNHKHRFMLVMFESTENNIYVFFRSHREDDELVVGFDMQVVS